MDAHILIVDDDAAIRDSMHEFVDMSGYQSSMAMSAEEALEMLDGSSVDVVITDIMLPGMDGLELTDRIKKNYDIDVIVMGALGKSELDRIEHGSTVANVSKYAHCHVIAIRNPVKQFTLPAAME